jgi:hypothetical protein
MNINDSFQTIKGLLGSYGNWIHHHLANGWAGYLLSFKFSQLSGSNALRMHQMKKHLGWFYGRLAKASVPKAGSPKWAPLLPKLIAAPDLPIAKHCKHSTREVTINDGIHWHGLVLVNPLTPKVHVPLDLANVPKYCVGSIEEIDVGLITHRPRDVTSYGMKGLKRREFDTDDVLIFPRSISELPTNTLET